ncbi:MAG TPA: CAP domain-containing protein [Thermoanaerobaculia bacterium]|nr:CAP domain-containing protein [Thermoanaerobaculia bacterium]
MIRRLVAAAAALSLFATSAFAGDLDRLAHDLERVFGKGSVAVSRGPSRSVPSHGLPAIVAEMNRQRAAHGLAPLRVNDDLNLAAGDRIADMFDQRYFAHVAPDGTQPFIWVSRRGYPYRAVGENLAVGYGTAQKVVRGWMESPGHRANILGRSYDEVGIAIANGAPVRGYGGPTIVAIYASR